MVQPKCSDALDCIVVITAPVCHRHGKPESPFLIWHRTNQCISVKVCYGKADCTKAADLFYGKISSDKLNIFFRSIL